jgi:probable rRNA maturation factor
VARSPKKQVHVDVSSTVRRRPISALRVREAVARVLQTERVSDALISVAFVGPAAMGKLNKDFLSHDGPTDVISFGLARASKASPVIGDIYICPRVAERNAKSLRITPKEELTRLVIHGMLHILGYDHPEGNERTTSTMWKRQERILDTFH